MASNIAPARPSLMRMDDNGEGNYASTASLYYEFQETDQGLTLPPKIQSNDSFESEPAETSSWGYEDLFSCSLSSADIDALLGFVQPELLGDEGRKEKSWVHNLKDHVGCQPSEPVSKGNFTGNLLAKPALPLVREDESIPVVEGGNTSASVSKALATHHVEQCGHCTVESQCALQDVHVAGKNEATPASKSKAQGSHSEQCSDYASGEEHSNSNACRTIPIVENADGVQSSLLDKSYEELSVPNNDLATSSCNEQFATAKSLSIMNKRGEDKPEYSPSGPDCPVSSMELGNGFSGRFERNGDDGKGGEPANQETLPIGVRPETGPLFSSGHEYQQPLQPTQLQDSSPQTNHHNKDDGASSLCPSLLPLAFCIEDKSCAPSVTSIIANTRQLLSRRLGDLPVYRTLTAPPEVDEQLFPGFEKLLKTFQTNRTFKSSAITWLLGKMNNGEYPNNDAQRAGLDAQQMEWIDSLSYQQLKRGFISALANLQSEKEDRAVELLDTSAQVANLQDNLNQAMARANAFRDALLGIDVGPDVDSGSSQGIQTPYPGQKAADNPAPHTASQNQQGIAKTSPIDNDPTSVSNTQGGTWKCLRMDNGAQCGQLNSALVSGRSKGGFLLRQKCSKCKKTVADHEKGYCMTDPEPPRPKARSKRKCDNENLHAYTTSPEAGSSAYGSSEMGRPNKFPKTQTPHHRGFNVSSTAGFETPIGRQSFFNHSSQISTVPNNQFTEHPAAGFPPYEGLPEGSHYLSEWDARRDGV